MTDGVQVCVRVCVSGVSACESRRAGQTGRRRSFGSPGEFLRERRRDQSLLLLFISLFISLLFHLAYFRHFLQHMKPVFL